MYAMFIHLILKWTITKIFKYFFTCWHTNGVQKDNNYLNELYSLPQNRNDQQLIDINMSATIMTRNWLVTLGNTTEDVANILMNQRITLQDLHAINPDDVKTLYHTARRPGGLLVNGDANFGIKVPVILQLKLATAVCASQYYEAVRHTISPVIMVCPVRFGNQLE